MTGGIGSGKSSVCALLEKRGIPVYDSDSRVKSLYAVNPSLAELVTPDIFRNEEQMSLLESRLYPVLMDDFSEWAAAQHSDCVAFESAIILQKHFFDTFGDVVLLVDAPLETRLSRAVSRGHASESSIRERIRLQRDERDNPRVDYIIDNIASERALEVETDKFLETIDYGKRKN